MAGQRQTPFNGAPDSLVYIGRYQCPAHRQFQRILCIVSILTILSATDASTAWATEYFVNIGHPEASDTNNGLSPSQPFKSLERAVQGLWPGDRLTISAGIYRESLEPWRSGTVDNRITVRASAGDERKVVIRGSDVISGWTAEGGNVWSHSFSPLPVISYPESWIDYGEYSRRREMLFVNETHFLQVLYREELAEGTFWVDESTNRLLVMYAGNINDTLVEVSVRSRGVWAQYASYFVWVGLRVDHIANDYSVGAINLSSNHTVFDCQVINNNQVGISITSNNVIAESEASSNGRTGIHVGGDGNLIMTSTTDFNSWRYGPRWAAAGINVISDDRPRDNQIIQHQARHNNSRGIWLDTTGASNKIEESLIEGNVLAGLRFEAAEGPNWAINNVILSTRNADDGGYPQSDGVGIELLDSRDTRIINNTIDGVAGSGILISGGTRNGGEDYPANSEVFNNIVVNSASAAVRFWLWDNGRIPDRVYSHVLNHNLYFGNEITVIYPELPGFGDFYWTLAQWQTNTGQDISSLEAPPEFVSSPSNSFILGSLSPAIDQGIALDHVRNDYFRSERPQGLATDIGAHEFCPSDRCIPIFSDDFEVGALWQWSESTTSHGE